MTRRNQERLSDIEDAIAAIGEYVAEGDLHQGVVYDACRARLMEIGEAVKHIDTTLLDQRPEVEISGSRHVTMRSRCNVIAS